MSPEVKRPEGPEAPRRTVLAKLAAGVIAAAGIVGPLRILSGPPKAELAPEAEPGEDSIFAPRRPQP